MNRWIQNGIGLSAMGALCISGWTAYELGATVRENRSDIRTTVAASRVGVADIFAESRDVTVALLKPCKPDKPATCGLIPGVERVAGDTGAAVRTMQTQVAATQPLIQSAATALTETAGAARTDLQTLNGTIAAAQPLLEAYTRSGDTLNIGLQTETADLHKVLIAAAGTMQHVDGIAGNGEKVSDHLEQEIDHPVKPKWYVRILPTSIRALIAGGQIYSAVR
jgi:hypothetical protein